MQPLPLLKIDCTVPGIVRLNGAFAGVTPAPDLYHYITENRVCLEFLPICTPQNGYWLPFTRLLDFGCNPPGITAADAALTLYLLPEGNFTLSLQPYYFAEADIPASLATQRFQFGSTAYLAEVYQDRGTCLALTDTSGNVVLTCRISVQLLQDIRLFTRRLGSRTYLFVQGSFQESLHLLCIDPIGRKLCFSDTCLQYQIQENSVLLYCDCQCQGFRLCRTYTLPEGSISLCQIEQHAAATPSAIAAAFFHALQIQDKQTSLHLLSPSLQSQLTFEDLLEFAGEFSHLYLPLCAGDTVALACRQSTGIFQIRIFTYEISHGKINNLSEQ